MGRQVKVLLLFCGLDRYLTIQWELFSQSVNGCTIYWCVTKDEKLTDFSGAMFGTMEKTIDHRNAMLKMQIQLAHASGINQESSHYHCFPFERIQIYWGRTLYQAKHQSLMDIVHKPLKISR